MSSIKYLCLDDEPEASQSTPSGIEKSGVPIEFRHPKSFETEAKECEKAFRDNKYDGLILDLRLDQKGTIDEPLVAYRASSLAQHLRTLSAEATIPSFPIILWSTDNKLKKSYRNDKAGHDLFDLVIDKSIVPDDPTAFALQLKALSLGYKTLASHLKGQSSAEVVLQIPEGAVKRLDPRFFSYFNRFSKPMHGHAYARSILTKLIFGPGILVNEATVAARLGVDPNKSTGWSALLSKISKSSSYKGPFHEAWPRWWLAGLDNWWETKIKSEINYLQMEANQRIALLKSELKASDLVAAKPIHGDHSTRFSTTCFATAVALDQSDGFAVEEIGAEPWQGRFYVSRQVALKPFKFSFDRKIDPLELSRLDSFKRKSS